MLSDKYRPKNQLDCDHANSLRDYEAAHKAWMNTSTFTEAGRVARANKEAARLVYEATINAKRRV